MTSNNNINCIIIMSKSLFYQKDTFVNSFINLVKECNEIILEIYNTDFSIISKDDNSPLTLADKKCNDHICKFLSKIPIENCGIISEEIKNDTYENRKNLEWTWLVDPLDGTKEFVKKNGQFTVNIGLCQFGVPVFGIVSIPVSGEIYYGVKDIGSYKLTNNNKIKLEVKNKSFEKNNLRVVASSSHMNEDTKKYISIFNDPHIVNVGSSIKLLWIAENKADVYPRIAPTCEWDTCAAHAVVKYANGKVENFESSKELIYNKNTLLNPYFLVY